MDIVLRTGFSKIKCNIDLNPESMSKGMKLVKANHVLSVEEIRKQGSKTSIIRARVIRQATISGTPYGVQLFVSFFQSS